MNRLVKDWMNANLNAILMLQMRLQGVKPLVLKRGGSFRAAFCRVLARHG